MKIRRLLFPPTSGKRRHDGYRIEMEKKKTSILLFVQFLLHLCQCHSSKDLSCYNDFNHTIDCVWISSDSFDSSNTECKLLAEYSHPNYTSYNASCYLKSLSVTTPTARNCSLIFYGDYVFYKGDELSISVQCNHVIKLVTYYVPSNHVKVNLGKPVVKFTTVSWFFQHGEIENWSYELQWKRHSQSWSDAVKLKQEHQKNGEFNQQLQQHWLTKDEKYEARVRMKTDEEGFQGPWSDWSPTVSWVSPVGSSENNDHIPSDSDKTFALSVWQMTAVGVAVIVLLLLVVLRRKNQTIWVYLVKKIQGAPVPNPAKSFLQKGWLNPPSATKSFLAFLQPEVVSVEVTSPVDVVSCCRLSIDMGERHFSNPTYSMLYALSPTSSNADGNLDPCPSDSPYGPVVSKDREQSPERDGAEEETLELLSKESGQMTSGPDKALRLRLELLRLQSLDSGVCTSEQVSEESIDQQDQTKACSDSPFSAACVGTRSIQLYYDYELDEKQQDQSLTLPEQDSDKQEDKSAESAHLLPHPFSLLTLSHTSSCSPGLAPSLQAFALMSSVGSVEPAGEGYMPVKQENS